MLVRQPFLPGEEGLWVEAKRRELHALLMRALDRLTDARLAAGEPRGAVTSPKRQSRGSRCVRPDTSG
jgi:hypothetical protein